MQETFRIIQHGNALFFLSVEFKFSLSRTIIPALQTHMFVTTATDPMRFIISYLPYSLKLFGGRMYLVVAPYDTTLPYVLTLLHSDIVRGLSLAR